MVCTSTDDQWYRMCELLERPDLGRGSRFELLTGRMPEADFIDRLVARWTRDRTAAEAIEILEERGIPAGAIRTLGEVLRNPHSAARRVAIEIPDHEGGTVLTAGPLAKMSLTPGTIDRCAPRLDQDRSDIDALLPRWEGRRRARAAGTDPGQRARRRHGRRVGRVRRGPVRGQAAGRARRPRRQARIADRRRHAPLPAALRRHQLSLPPLQRRQGVSGRGPEIGLGPGRSAARAGAGGCLTSRIWARAWSTVSVSAMPTCEPATRASSTARSAATGAAAPMRGGRAYDTVIQGESGIMSLTGRHRPADQDRRVGGRSSGPDLRLRRPSSPPCTTGAGTALARSWTASMFDVCVWTTQTMWPEAGAGDGSAAPDRSDLRRPGGIYPAADGAVSIGVENRCPAARPRRSPRPRTRGRAARRPVDRARISPGPRGRRLDALPPGPLRWCGFVRASACRPARSARSPKS